MCIATTWPNLRSNQNKRNIIAVALVYIIYIDGICTVYTGIRAVYAGIRWYTLVCAGIRVVYARYTRGIREAFVVYAWYTRGIRVVYARYTRGIREAFVVYGGIRAVYAWYLRGIRVVYAGIRS